MIKVDQTLCAGCAMCVTTCPEEAIECPGMAVIDPEICTECLACLDSCPTDALSYWESERERGDTVVLVRDSYEKQES